MRKKLKIYLPFAANELKRQMAYKGAFYLFMFISLFSSFIMYFLDGHLWKYGQRFTGRTDER